jgi:DNA-binding NtrC family response regulator
MQEAVSERVVRPRILVVDDEDGVRESLRAVLELSEFDVKTAANVSEAIHLIDTEAFDCSSLGFAPAWSR